MLDFCSKNDKSRLTMNTNMEFDVFLLLRKISSLSNATQRELSRSLGWSLGKVNSLYQKLSHLGLVCNGAISSTGKASLSPYKVKNAIILAAGMSTRFAPVSYDVPKALICVKGEILIERIIRQLKDKGIEDITIVIGYKMEKFLYLKDKFDVRLVVNNEFRIKNTHSSINVVKNFLSNTYIICADNYFAENVFEQYEYRAFYGAQYIKERNNERGFVLDKHNLIIDTNKPSQNQFVMWGHAYFDKSFTEAFLPILEYYYGRQGIENYYWETIYIENLDKLHMHAKIYNPGIIYEFDSISELEQFDRDYIKNNSIEIINNICSVLGCEAKDITILEKLSGGLSNSMFKFECCGKCYVYRYPGDIASIVNDRKREYASTKMAFAMGIDETNLYLDEKTGWKVSRFFDANKLFDPRNDDHIKMLACVLKRLHNPEQKKLCGFKFDTFEEALKLKSRVLEQDSSLISFLDDLENKATKVYKIMKSDNWEICFSHNDISDSNLLVRDKEMVLIDWEFAGDNDIGYDLAKLFCLTDYSEKRMIKNLSYYFEREPTYSELRHILCCVVINYFYWINWGIFMNKNGFDYLSWLLLWHERFTKYLQLVEEYK